MLTTASPTCSTAPTRCGARRSAPLLQVSPALRRLGAAYCWIVVGAAIVPFVAVVVISFMRFSGPVLQFGLSVDNFAQLFQRSYRPLTNTLLLATLAACGATLIGVPIGYIVTRHRSRVSALIDIVASKSDPPPGESHYP